MFAIGVSWGILVIAVCRWLQETGKPLWVILLLCAVAILLPACLLKQDDD